MFHTWSVSPFEQLIATPSPGLSLNTGAVMGSSTLWTNCDPPAPVVTGGGVLENGASSVATIDAPDLHTPTAFG